MPLAVAGLVTPLLAAAVMASSSLIPIALFLGLLGLGGFLWALRAGQYEDLDGAAARILFDDTPPRKDP